MAARGRAPGGPGESPLSPGRASRSDDVSRLVEHLFRHESGRLVARLVRILGVARIDRAEEIVQETLVRALQSWPYHGVPDNPPAWLMRVATNRALDALRGRDARRRGKDAWRADRATLGEDAAPPPEAHADGEIEDDVLRMMFACCHPALPPEGRIALTLNLVGGLTVPEIADAFLTSEQTLRKRLYRAKRTMRESVGRLEIPAGDELAERRDAVLHVLYLVFTEGLYASRGEDAVREDLCYEALRLALLVTRHPRIGDPAADALVALFALHLSRLPARLAHGANDVLLGDQDRALWNAPLVEEGLTSLERASCGPRVTRYHLEASIAACHARATSLAGTDWATIVSLYDRLLERWPSPVVALNRAIAAGYRDGYESVIPALEALRGAPELAAYTLLPAALGDACHAAGRTNDALAAYEEALGRARSESERRTLRRKIDDVKSRAANADPGAGRASRTDKTERRRR